MIEIATANGADPDIENASTLPSVLFVGNFEFPAKNAAATRILAIARLFSLAGCNVVLVGVSRDKQIGPDDIRRVSSMDGFNADVWETGYPRTSMEWITQIASMRSVKQLILQHYNKRVLGIVCYNSPTLAQLDAKRVSRRHGAFVVADLSEWPAKRPGFSFRSLVKNLDTFVQMHWGNKQMDGIICSSPYFSRHYSSFGKPMLELPTLVEPKGDKREGNFAVTPDGTAKRLLFAGTGFDPAVVRLRADDLKDRLDWVLSLLAMVAERNVPFRFDVFGVERENYMSVVPHHRSLLESLGERVRFHGNCSHDLVVSELKNADYSIFLRAKSRMTLAGFPTKFSESIALGTPVITNPLENVAPYLIDGKTGFSINPENQECAVATLVKALTLPADQVTEMKHACLGTLFFRAETFVPDVKKMIHELQAGLPNA